MEQSEYEAELVAKANDSHDRIFSELKSSLRKVRLEKKIFEELSDYLTARSASLHSDQKRTIDRHLNNLKALSGYNFSLQGKLKRAEEKSFKINMSILEDAYLTACQLLIDKTSKLHLELQLDHININIS